MFAREARKLEIKVSTYSVQVHSTDKDNHNTVTILEINKHTDNSAYAQNIADLLQRELTKNGDSFLVYGIQNLSLIEEYKARFNAIVGAYEPYVEKRMPLDKMAVLINTMFLTNHWE